MDYETFPHYWVNHLGFQLRRHLERGFAAQGYKITAEEWAMLLILNKHEALSPSDLSRLTLRDTTTVSRLIDRLERKELIARMRIREDRRIVDIQMTAAGRALFADLAVIAKAVIQSSLAGFSEPDIQLVTRLLHKMSQNLSAAERVKDV